MPSLSTSPFRALGTALSPITSAVRRARESLAGPPAAAGPRALLLSGQGDQLFGIAHDAVLLLDGDARILEVNEHAPTWYGYAADELIGRHLWELRPPEARDAFAEVWATLRREGRVWYESVHRHKDGTDFHVEVSIRTIRVRGEHLHVGVVRDVTDRWQANQRAARLARLHAVVSHCLHAIARPAGIEALCERVCQVAVEFGGFQLATAAAIDNVSGSLVPVARRVSEGLELEAAASMADAIVADGPARACLTDDVTVTCQDFRSDASVARWRDDAERFGLRSFIALPVRRDGRALGVLSLHADEPQFFDADETGLAEELAGSLSFALDSLAHRERIERVLEAMDEGFWEWNVSTGEMHLSPRLETMLGYERGQMPRDVRQWLDLVHIEDRPGVTARLQDIFAPQREVVAGEFRVQRQSGEYIWVFGRVRSLAPSGVRGVVRLVGTIMDITARKGLEDQFLQSQRLETVGRLAGAVAHDFNNVLTVINGYSDLLLADLKDDDPDRSSLEAIRQAGERASGITRQLLTFSRKHASDPRVVSLGSAVREVERMARGVLREAVNLSIQLEAIDDAVFIDPAHLHQVLMNLIVNARDAMPQGGSLRIATSCEDLADGRGDVEPGRYLCLTVTDTGTGMDAATLGRIFEPFFTTKEQGRGTGLGLSTVHGIIAQAGGAIRVQSTPGVGTTFRLYLPPATAETAEPASLAVPTAVRRGSETILVVEDQEDVRDVTVAVLRGAGYAVLAASDGPEALHTAARHEGRIDLVLTDVIMPGMDGKSLAEALTASRPGLRVLYTSGYTDDVLSAHDIDHAGTGYLAKPFTPDGLMAAVREVLGPGEARPTVLIVDDDIDVRRLFGEALADRYTVLMASDGVQALETVRTASRVDIVLIDLFMPRQDGTQTILALREMAPQLPIIAISGAFGGQFLSAAERVGVAATLAKPVSLETLRRLVEKLCPTRTSTDR